MKIQRFLVAHVIVFLLAAGALAADVAAGKTARTVRLLTVGNSFSRNATHFLPDLATAGGHTLIHRPIVVGGASMQLHAEQAQRHEADAQDAAGRYANGRSLQQELAAEPWDFVTIQQASIKSHDLNTYRPYAGQLGEFIRKYAPGAKLLVHETWAYRCDDPRFAVKSPGPGEPATQEAMYQGLAHAYRTIAAELGARRIPVGDAFYQADHDPQWGYRPDATFDFGTAQPPALPDQTHSLHVGWRWTEQKSGPPKLGMDGHHANAAGEYLGACVFYEVLFGETVVGNGFAPPGLDPAYARFLQETAHRAVTDAAVPTAKRFPLYGSFDEMVQAAEPVLPAVRAVTRGPKFHWFGYYDKFQLDPSNRYLLGMEVDFEHRLPESNEAVRIGMVDLAEDDRWIELGESRAWCWQQGCMLQWRPGSDREVVWNDREGDRFVCRVLDVRTRQVRTLPRAVGSISPDGRLAVCEDFSRIWSFRPGYAYAGVPDPYADQPAPAEIGVWRMDLDTGESQLIVSVADLVKIPYPRQSPSDRHYVNHLSWSPDGKRFLLFNRWSGPGQPTRVFTAAPDGHDLRLLSARDASHWTWRDPEHVLIWAGGGYRLYRDDGSGEPQETLWEAPNGHQTYLPGTRNEWIVTDSYPRGATREQTLYLFHVPTRRFVLLGRFPSTYQGEWRCDSHPRVSRDGKLVIIDSPHGGNGRQQYVIDISPVLAGAS